MKKKKTKNIKKKKQKLSFPQQLAREDLFKCPIWFAKELGFVDNLNKASDSYVKNAKKNLKPDIDNEIKSLVIRVIWVMYFIQHL